MKCFITGANGFVGSHMIEYILENHPEYEVYGLRRSHTSSMKYVEHISDPRLKWIMCDFTDAFGINKIFEDHKFDKVFHLGAQSLVPVSFTNPSQTIYNNIIGTVNILEAIRKYNSKAVVMICASSEVYGHNENNPTRETERFTPLSPYAFSKVGEDVLGYVYNKAYGIKTVMSRAFTHTGRRRSYIFFESSFARQVAMIEKGLQEPVIYVGNLESKRTIMNVKDCVKAYWLLTEFGKYGESYNVGGKELWSVYQVLYYLISLSPKKDEIKVEVKQELLRPSDINIQIPSREKLQGICNWEVEFSVADTLKELLNYWREELK